MFDNEEFSEEERMNLTNKGRDMKLTDALNDQELLYLCLTLYNSDNVEEDAEGLSLRIVTMAAVRNLDEKNPDGEFTESEVQEEMNQMIFGHTLDGMVKKGLLEEDIDGKYTLTDLGKDMADQVIDE